MIDFKGLPHETKTALVWVVSWMLGALTLPTVGLAIFCIVAAPIGFAYVGSERFIFNVVLHRDKQIHSSNPIGAGFDENTRKFWGW